MSQPKKWFGKTQSQANGTLPTLSTVQQQKDLAKLEYWERQRGRGRERLWGFENFGNSCYCNSVLQALYHCQVFRQCIESYPDVEPSIIPLGGAPAPFPSAANGGLLSPVLEPTSPTPKSNPFDNPTFNPSSPPTKDKSKWSLTRRPTSSQSSLPVSSAPAQPQQPPKATIHPLAVDIPMDGKTMLSTIQTLFHHLSTSEPHRPAPPRVAPAANGNGIAAAAGDNSISAPSASLIANNTWQGSAYGPPATPGAPAGPPLLASLPAPSAPRAGGPFGAGTLGRGVVRPEDVIRVVRERDEKYRPGEQQDAHEFLGFLLTQLEEDLAIKDRELLQQGKAIRERGRNFVHNLFAGVIATETRCLSCETTSSRDEPYYDLSIDPEQYSSVTACLRRFSKSEMLCQKNKFHCDACGGLQEAERRMLIKNLPPVLALHLKRFKFHPPEYRYVKLFYRVAVPLELRVPNTVDDIEGADRLYQLFAIVVHIGNGPGQGHYVTIARSAGRWVMCDDENVEPLGDADLYRYFGDYATGANYVLFYQEAGIDIGAAGLKVVNPVEEDEDEEELVDIQPVDRGTTALPTPIRSVSGYADTGNGAVPTTPRTPATPVTPVSASTSSVHAANGVIGSPTPAPAVAAAPTLFSAPKDKEEKRGLFRRKKDSGPLPPPQPQPARHESGETVGRSTMRRQSTSQTFNTVNTATSASTTSTTFNGLGVSINNASLAGRHPETVQGIATPIPVEATSAATAAAPQTNAHGYAPLADRPDQSPQNMSSSMMSSSMMSTFSGLSVGSSTQSSAPSAPSAASAAQPIARRDPSAARARTASNPSDAGLVTSSSLAGALGTSAPGGFHGGRPIEKKLSRRLSGAMGVGKLARSGSTAFGKIGFGRKKGIEENE
ncbi:hypothetical protein Q5752_000750 [Cryptotrichosporon argae]